MFTLRKKDLCMAITKNMLTSVIATSFILGSTAAWTQPATEPADKSDSPGEPGQTDKRPAMIMSTTSREAADSAHAAFDLIKLARLLAETSARDVSRRSAQNIRDQTVKAEAAARQAQEKAEQAAANATETMRVLAAKAAEAARRAMTKVRAATSRAEDALGKAGHADKNAVDKAMQATRRALRNAEEAARDSANSSRNAIDRNPGTDSKN
ncbi:MAG: hypothetical protein V4573_14150 [Pseudomonadota bacterium]